MQSALRSLDRWTYWGYQGSANNNPPGNYEMYVDGTPAGKGEFMQCAAMSPGACDPQQSGRAVAGGASMEFTWLGGRSMPDKMDDGGHIDLSAFEIVEVAEPGTQPAPGPEYPQDDCDYDRNPEGCFVPPPGGGDDKAEPPPEGGKGAPPPKGR